MTMPSPDGQRIPPAMAPGEYKTYQILTPRGTHYRPGSCAEAECAAHLNGWRTVVDERTELGQAQGHYVRRESGRRFLEETGEDGLTVFTFEAGQRCFAEAHQVPLGRPELYVVRDGDWRGNPRGTEPYRHAGPDNWVDDFATHQDRLSRIIERG
jgi:hypothetical protein